jgi:Ca2+-binding RTX toxin-like protein
MTRFVLTNRDDEFDSRDQPRWYDGSRVDGGNGHDTVRVFGDRNDLFGGNGEDILVAFGDRNVLDGGNGKDLLRVIGDGNQLFGGNGVDILVAFGEGNRMDGGNGADALFSISRGRPGQVGEGNVMTGGHGFDTYTLNNRSDLRVVNDLHPDPHLLPGSGPAPGVGMVSEGDIIVGVMDEITDYTAGERLRINAHDETSGPVEINGPGLGATRLDLADGEYAFIRGDQITNGRFEVDGAGGDLLLVYDARGGGDALFLQGAVVLQGVTDPDSVVIA